jgi:prepilin signal peptidase PulO-like enzyme (type II secretory pathway)
MLRGKCRYCHKPIDDSPITELATAALFVLSYLAWPLALEGSAVVLFVIWLVLIVVCMAMVVYDLRWMELPDKLTYTGAVVAAIYVVAAVVINKDASYLVNALGGVLVIGGLFFGLFQISKGKWIGGGDVKLSLMLGLMASGIMEGFLLVFMASLLGTLVAVPLVALKKKNLQARLPFGPFLIGALVIVVLFGQRIIEWYQQFLLI